MKPAICATKACRNKAAKGRSHCHKCRKAAWRGNHPIKAAFNALRDSARNRGIEFGLTYEQFEEFCFKTKLIAGRGRKNAETFSVDRIKNEYGYFDWNIRLLTVGENAKKEQERRKAEGMVATHKKILHYDWKTKEGYFVTRPIIEEPEEDCPF